MNPANIQPQKEARGHASLGRKLAFLEFWRRFWLVISIDISIIIMVFAGTIAFCEYTAKRAVENGVSGGIPGIYSIEESSGPQNGRGLEPWIDQFVDDHGGIRNLWVSERYYGNPLRTMEHLQYSISIPKDNPGNHAADPSVLRQYQVVTFTLAGPVVIFKHIFAVLLVFEAIGLVGDAFKIRGSVRRTLRPIYDLTLAAQTVNMSANPIIALPEVQELHLSGAIDTLNTITENDLDRRIVITDERAELRGLAQAINAMLDRLDAAYRSQLRFVSDASHELRTPIAVIQGYANLLDRWGKNDQVTLQESIDAIKSEASGMQDLVEQLLFLARSDNRSIVLNVEVVNTYLLADEVLRETQMIDPNHEFQSRLTEGLVVRGDIQLLKQALRIFVDNAIKYAPQGSKITISTVGDADFTKISVSDNGIGIPADDLPRVFDRFFRADESRTRGTGGTGLGLSIAKWIVDRHGGYVEIVSRENIGTKVTVALPSYKAAPAPI